MLGPYRFEVAWCGVSILFILAGDYYAGCRDLLLIALVTASMAFVSAMSSALSAVIGRNPRRVLACMVGVIAAAACVVVSARIIFGVPEFVKNHAAGIIRELDVLSSKSEFPVGNGYVQFEEPLQSRLEANRCSVLGRGASYKLTCMGVGFTKCTFDSDTRRWYAWD